MFSSDFQLSELAVLKILFDLILITIFFKREGLGESFHGATTLSCK